MAERKRCPMGYVWDERIGECITITNSGRDEKEISAYEFETLAMKHGFSSVYYDMLDHFTKLRKHERETGRKVLSDEERIRGWLSELQKGKWRVWKAPKYYPIEEAPIEDMIKDYTPAYVSFIYLTKQLRLKGELIR